MLVGYAMNNGVCCFSSSTDQNNKFLLLEITNRCNFRCSYCHVPFDHMQDTLLSESKIDEILGELHLLKFTKLAISGGEPLLYRGLEKILQIAKKHEFNLDLCTNGSLLTETKVRMLRRYMDQITVTMDCLDDEIFHQMKGIRNGFKAVVNGMNKLLAHDFQVNVTIVLTRLNHSKLEATTQWLANIGVSSITFLRLYDTPLMEELSINEREKRIIESSIRRIISTADTGKSQIKTKGIIFDSENIGACRAGETIFGIDTTGYLLPCILIRKLDKTWDLKHVSVRHAIESSAMRDFVSKKNALSCGECVYNAKCDKGCIATGYIVRGEIMPDLHCPWQALLGQEDRGWEPSKTQI